MGILAAALAGCAVQSAALQAHWPSGLPDSAELTATPFFPQTAFHCGPAALATALGAIGIAVEPQAVAERVFLPARQGTLQVEMIAGARREGAVATRIPGTVEAVLREVAAGHPVVILQNLGLSVAPAWHYAVVVGYERANSEIVLRSGTERRERMALRTFEHTWQRAGSWAFVVLPPGRWPVTAAQAAAVEAAVGFERTAAPRLAVQVYASAVQRWPGEPVLAVGLGNAAHASGQMIFAADSFGHAARTHGSVPAWINLARTLLDAGHPDAALEAAHAAARARRPDDVWQGQLAEVTRDAEEALAQRPAAAKVHPRVTAENPGHRADRAPR